MPKSGWINTAIMKEKRYLLLAIAVVLAIIIIYFFFIKDPGRPPKGMLDLAISQTSDSRNFRYQVVTQTNINGKKNTFSQVTGEKFRPDNLHIKGEVMKSPIDIYQINENIYAKDNFGGKWVRVDISELNQDGNFMNELNPLENFSFRELGDVNYKGVEKTKKSKCWVYQLRPEIDNHYMEALWSDFTYRIWVSPGEKKVAKTEIRARGKDNDKDEIIITIQFYDYGDVKPINPPV